MEQLQNAVLKGAASTRVSFSECSRVYVAECAASRRRSSSEEMLNELGILSTAATPLERGDGRDFGQLLYRAIWPGGTFAVQDRTRLLEVPLIQRWDQCIAEGRCSIQLSYVQVDRKACKKAALRHQVYVNGRTRQCLT
jgi:hypothetical protein